MEVCLKAGGLFYVHTSQLLRLMNAANYIKLIEPPENAVVELGTHKPFSFLSFSVMSYAPGVWVYSCLQYCHCKEF
jgi:hypothetical protein